LHDIRLKPYYKNHDNPPCQGWGVSFALVRRALMRMNTFFLIDLTITKRALNDLKTAKQKQANINRWLFK